VFKDRINKLYNYAEFIPPKRSGYINRTALSGVIPRVGERKLTIIQSQPGFGKTSLLIDIFEQIKQPKLWVSISETDNNPITFLERIVVALEGCSEAINTSFINQLGVVPTPSLSPLINSMVSECKKNKINYIFFDDIDLLTDPVSNEVISNFLSDIDDPIRVIVTCSSPPNFSYTHLLLNNNVTLIEDALLHFTTDDVRALLNLNQLAIADDELVNELVKVTDGWPTAVQFVLSTLKNGDGLQTIIEELKSGHINLALYFAQRAYNNQTEEVRDFMHKISVVDQFNLALCYDITQDKNAHEKLSNLVDSNTFIYSIYDDWYRFNPLYLRYLQKQATFALGTAALSACKSRSANWLYDNHYYTEAINIALEAKDFDKASQWILNNITDVVKRHGRHNEYIDWVKALPKSQLDKYPLLRVNYVLVLCLTKQFQKAKENTSIVLSQLDKLDENTKNSVERQVGLASCIVLALKDDIKGLNSRISQWLNSWGSRQHFDQSYDYHFELALANLIKGFSCKCISDFSEGKSALIEASNHFEVAESYFGKGWSRAIMAVLYAKQGCHYEALNEAKDGLKEVKEHLGAESHPGHILSALIGAIHYEHGDLKLASKYIQNGLTYIKEQSSTDILIAAFETRYKVRVAEDSLEEGIGILKDGIKWSDKAKLSRLKLSLVDDLVSLLVIHDRLEEAESYAAIYKINYSKNEDYDAALSEHRIVSKSIIHLQLAHGKYDNAINILHQLIERSRQRTQMRQLANWLMLISVAYFKANDKKNALSYIEESLDIARTRNYVRMYIDEGANVAEILSYVSKAHSSSQVRSFVNLLLKDFKSLNTEPSCRFVKLTIKEREIITQLETGLLNKQIANEIGISEGTLKWHLHNIYSKFNVKNRTQALLIAQEEGYI